MEVDDILVEIATDKVDSDLPSEVSGVLIEKKFAENEVVQVGEVMAVIQTEGDETEVEPALEVEPPKEKIEVSIPKAKTLSLPDPLPEFESVSKTIEDAKAMASPQISVNNSEFSPPGQKHCQGRGAEPGGAKKDQGQRKDKPYHQKRHIGLFGPARQFFSHYFRKTYY